MLRSMALCSTRLGDVGTLPLPKQVATAERCRLEPEVTGPDYGTIPESEANYGTAPTYTWDLSYRREYAVRGIEVLNCTLRSELMMQIEEAPPYLSLTEEQRRSSQILAYYH